ncbi:MAG TPA: TonB-dependent receptor plug domain-containing protein, partial [Allosphingosinicella sp.]
MTRRYLRSAALAAAVLAAPAAASPAARQIALPAGPMAAALAQLVRQSGVELLFDPALVRNLKSRRVAGRLTAAQALSKLLEGSGVGFRKSGGAFVLYPLPAPDRADRPAPAAPDILITGRRTQNADIRRTENDIQPYRVLDRAEIRDSHRDTVEEFLRSAETADAQTAAPGQIVENADPRSSIDLRGAGSSRTLVLVDGRRMPSVPTMRFDSVQPDLNGIPLTAIERIEILTGSAGGIYGPGALGGVLNVILRRDYNGADLRIATGVTSRGDAATASIEGRIGLSFNHGRTGVTLVAGTRTAEPLRRGERDFELRRRLLQFRNDPAGYVRQRLKATTSAVLPRSDAITVASVNGANLVLDPQYGGSTLASSYSFLPPDFAGTPAEAIALLKQNAGTLRFEPADDLAGGRAYLGARPSATSVLLNVRQSLGSGAEAYMDGLWLKNRAVSEIATAEEAVTLPDAPTNPFSQLVFFTFPRPELVGRYEQRIDTRRLSTGIILGPPKGWRATADLTLGSVSVDRTGLSQVINFDLLRAIQTGRSARPGLPVPDPLGGLPRLAAALAEYRETSLLDQRLENRFMDASVRVSGPLLKLRGGPLTATAVLEWRREHVPATERTIRFTERTDVVESSERTQRVASASVELRAPLTGPKPPLPILRGLELQLAARYDHAVTDYVDGFGVALGFEDPPTRSRRNAVTYTAGIRAFPAPFLMIRASTATGELPPTIDNLRSTASAFRLNDPALGDPQRGGRPIGSERPFRLLYG